MSIRKKRLLLPAGPLAPVEALAAPPPEEDKPKPKARARKVQAAPVETTKPKPPQKVKKEKKDKPEKKDKKDKPSAEPSFSAVVKKSRAVLKAELYADMFERAMNTLK